MKWNMERWQISKWIVVLAATSALSSCYRGEKAGPTTPEPEPFVSESWERRVVEASPAQVPGTQVTYEQTGDGATIAFRTRGDVDEVRRRAERLAELHDRIIEIQVYQIHEELACGLPTEGWCSSGNTTWGECRLWCDGTLVPIPPGPDPLRQIRIEATVDEIPDGARIRLTLESKLLLRQLMGDYAAYMTSLMVSPGQPDVGDSAVSPATRATHELTGDDATITLMTTGDVDVAKLHDRRIRVQVYRERASLFRDDDEWEEDRVITCEECINWCCGTTSGVRVESVVDETLDGTRIRLTFDGQALLSQLTADYLAYTMSLVRTPGLSGVDASGAPTGAGRVER